MAVKWIKLKMPYGARHISSETDMVIEDHVHKFTSRPVEVWWDPIAPTCTCVRFESVRVAKLHVNKRIKELKSENT